MIIVIRSTNLADDGQTRRRIAPQVMRKLIDEALQIDEAERRNIKVSENDLKIAFGSIEKQIRIAPGTMQSFIEAQGVDFEVFREKTRAEVAWAKLINIRLRPQVRITDDDISEGLAQMKANAGKSEYLVSEIVFAIDRPQERELMRRQALRMRGEISDQRSFAEAARQFSAGPTAVQGGSIGWTQPGQLTNFIIQEKVFFVLVTTFNKVITVVATHTVRISNHTA